MCLHGRLVSTNCRHVQVPFAISTMYGATQGRKTSSSMPGMHKAASGPFLNSCRAVKSDLGTVNCESACKERCSDTLRFANEALAG